MKDGKRVIEVSYFSFGEADVHSKLQGKAVCSQRNHHNTEKWGRSEKGVSEFSGSRSKTSVALQKGSYICMASQRPGVGKQDDSERKGKRMTGKQSA
jgi:hypothetical protein